jgi:hypothetical protein
MDVRNFKNVLSAVLRQMDIKTKEVYPAVGFYMQEGKVIYASNEMVFPLLDAQKRYASLIKECEKEYPDEKKKEVLQASINFIMAMPKDNQLSALITRGFSFISPLGYMLKQSPLGVFPYLYLYGEKGSSKTHIADVSTTYTFGEKEHLTSDSVNSAFRLGMEFSSCTFPRVIDEAHGIFTDNISTFKSAATSTIATKRGNKDKTLDTYPSFCSYLFTSNMIPIAPEEDQANALMDRVIVVECFSGRDFDRGKYLPAHTYLLQNGAVLGGMIIEILKNINYPDFQSQILDLANTIQDENPQTTQRRAYCLAYLVWGVQEYLMLLAKYGLDNPWKEYSNRKIMDMIVNKAKADTMDENAKVVNMLTWAFSLPGDEMQRFGVYPGKLDDESGKPTLILHNNMLKKYAQYFSMKQQPYHSLSEVSKDLKRIGLIIEADMHSSVSKKIWGLKVSPADFEAAMECRGQL